MTVREAEVVTLLFQGVPQKQIGERLGMRHGTVKVTLSRVYEKAGCSSALDLLSMAYRNGGFLY